VPRKRKVGLQRRLSNVNWELATDPEHSQLITGHDFFDQFGDDLDAAREGWQALRGELLPAFVDKYPGTRPWAWWEFEASEPRRRLGGKGLASIDDPKAPEWAKKMSFGVPTVFTWLDWQDWPQYESEREYLARHNLLTKKEPNNEE